MLANSAIRKVIKWLPEKKGGWWSVQVHTEDAQGNNLRMSHQRIPATPAQVCELWFLFFSHCVYTRWHALFIGTDLSTLLYCWPPFISSLTLLTLAGVWQLNTLYHYSIHSRTDVELIAAFLFPIFEVTHSWPSLSPVGFFCSSSLSLGHLLNVPLQVCLDIWNEMWFLLTSVTTNIHLGVGGMSFAFGGKKTLSYSSEATRWFSSWVFYQLSSYIQGASMEGHLRLSRQNARVQQTPKLLLPNGSVNEIEHDGTDFLAPFFSLDWLTLINPGRWFQMMPVKLDLTAQLFIISHCPGLSLWHSLP